MLPWDRAWYLLRVFLRSTTDLVCAHMSRRLGLSLKAIAMQQRWTLKVMRTGTFASAVGCQVSSKLWVCTGFLRGSVQLMFKLLEVWGQSGEAI
jgi:hypothetical protein